MSKSILKQAALRICLTLGLFTFCAPGLNAQTTGIFADFKTSKGDFTIHLDFTNAPMTVANFIGLATGQRPWMDWHSGQVKTNPFYDGLIFHRVVSNFVIQAGSPNGLGNDGPGYVIKDEISSKLTHNRTGAVAMAKSPYHYDPYDLLAHTASSQFYITTTTNANTRGLNGSYSVFGHVISNLSVVRAIGKVQVDTNDRPMTNVVINSVTIRRVGTAAQNFNIATNPLPLVSRVPVRAISSNQQVTLQMSNNVPYAANRLFSSPDLAQWYYEELGIDLAPPLLTNVVQNATNRSDYYRTTRVQYPASTWAPRNLYGRTLRMTFDDGSGTVAITFDSNGGGTYTDGAGGTGEIYSYGWYPDIYRAYFEPLDAWNTFYIHLDFVSETAGTFAGYVYLGLWWPTGGTFTLQ